MSGAWGLKFLDAGSTGGIYSHHRFAGDSSGATGGTTDISAGGNHAD